MVDIDDVTVPGWNFDAWPAESMVTLVNVPWSNTYRDAVLFDDRGALNAYIDSRVSEQADIRTNMSYVPTNRPIRLADPENRLYRYNYLRVSNPLIPGTRDYKKDYYYFITDVQFVNGGTTLVTVQLDVFQTFIYDVTFGNCYVERGHIGIANENAFADYGRRNLTVPEGLDTGSNYGVFMSYRWRIMGSGGTPDYLVCSTIDLTADFGTSLNPSVETAKGGLIQGTYSGASYYIIKGSQLPNFMARLSLYPWIAQGITSITAIPEITRYVPNYDYTEVSPDLPVSLPPASRFDPYVRPLYVQGIHGSDTWRNELINSLPARYRGLRKFLTAPYSFVELTTNTGTPLQLQPEMWDSSDMEVSEHVSLPLPNQRIGIYPVGYNSLGSDNFGDGDEYDRATMVSNLPQIPVVNDAGALALANQAHSLAYQRSSADWSQQKALRGNALSYDQSTAGIGLQQDVLNQQQQTERTNQENAAQWANSDALRGTIMKGGGGALGGGALGPAGAAIGVAGGLGAGLMNQWQTSLDNQRAAETMGINQRSAQAVNNLQAGNQRYVRDTNRSLSDWAARGDYENTIAGLQAKVQDTELSPPSIAGQVGGEGYGVGSGSSGVTGSSDLFGQSFT